MWKCYTHTDMSTRDLPDMYALRPRDSGCRASSLHIRQISHVQCLDPDTSDLYPCDFTCRVLHNWFTILVISQTRNRYIFITLQVKKLIHHQKQKMVNTPSTRLECNFITLMYVYVFYKHIVLSDVMFYTTKLALAPYRRNVLSKPMGDAFIVLSPGHLLIICVWRLKGGQVAS